MKSTILLNRSTPLSKLFISLIEKSFNILTLLIKLSIKGILPFTVSAVSLLISSSIPKYLAITGNVSFFVRVPSKSKQTLYYYQSHSNHPLSTSPQILIS